MDAKEIEALRQEVLRVGAVLLVDDHIWGSFRVIYAKVVSAEPEPDGGFFLTVDPGYGYARRHFTDRDYDLMWFLSGRKAALMSLGMKKVWLDNRIRDFERTREGVAAEIEEIDGMPDEEFDERDA